MAMSKSKLFLLASLIFLGVDFFAPDFFVNPKNSDFLWGDFYNFSGQVVSTDKKLDGWNLIFRPSGLSNFSGKILIYAPLYPEYDYGDVLEIKCRLNRPEPLADETGKVFAYDKYLAKDDIWALCFRPQIKLIGQNKDLGYYLSRVRNYFWHNLDDYLVEPASSLAKATLLGAQREFSPEIRSIFSKVGLSHIIAISGSHMVIIVWLIQSLLLSFGLRRQSVFVFLLISLIFYLALINWLPSALRSCLMVMITLVGPFLGRASLSVYSLVLVADVLAIANPYLLRYDLGFELSFLSVFGLIFYSRFLEKIFFCLPDVFKIREVLATTLAAQFFIWPLITYNFGILSLISPLANFLILPLATMILIFGFILAIFGYLSILGQLAAWPLFILFKIMVEVGELLSRVPYAYLNINGFSRGYLVFSYIFLLLFTFVLKPQDYE